MSFIVSNPYVFSFKVNFGIFLKILRMLISKLKAQQMSFHDYKYRYVINNKEVLASPPPPFFSQHQKVASWPLQIIHLPTITRCNRYSEYDIGKPSGEKDSTNIFLFER